MNQRVLWIVLLLFACCAPPGMAREMNPDLKKLVNRTIEAYGGQKALQQIQAFSQSGTVISSRGKGTVSRVFQGPDRLRVEISFPGETPEVRVLIGQHGFRNGTPVEGPPRDAMELQAARFQLPLSLVAALAELQDLGSGERHGRKVRRIRMPLSLEKATLTVEIDEETGYIVRSTGTAPGGAMGALEFVTDYSDFRKVQGVVFAFTEESSAMGQKTGETRLDKIELLKAAPEGTFQL